MHKAKEVDDWVMIVLFKAILSVPFWFIYSVCGIGKKFFYFLPEVYQEPGFWATFGLFMVISVLYVVFIPTFAFNSQNIIVQNVSKEEKQNSEV